MIRLPFSSKDSTSFFIDTLGEKSGVLDKPLRIRYNSYIIYYNTPRCIYWRGTNETMYGCRKSAPQIEKNHWTGAGD